MGTILTLGAGPGAISSSSGSLPLSPLDWWDPDLGAYQDTGKTTAAIANNDPIACLVGQTGSYGDLTNTAGTVRPLLKTNAVNGHSSILFDGSNDYLSKTAARAKPCMIIFALKMVTWTLLDEIFGNTSAARGRLIQHSTSPNIRLQLNALGTEQSSPGLGTWGIVSLRFGSGTNSASFRLNNNARVTQDDTTGNFEGLSFGKAYNLAPSNVEIGRMALYAGDIGQTDEDTIMSSFMTYYGVT